MYLIMRNDITGEVKTKDFSFGGDQNKRTATGYAHIMGCHYTFWLGSFTEPFVDERYLAHQKANFDYIATTDHSGRREYTDKYGTHVQRVRRWKLHPVGDNPPLDLVTEKQSELKKACAGLGMDLDRIKWFKYYGQVQ